MSLAPRTVEGNAPQTARRGARGSNQSGMRAHNERLVLSLIRQSGPMPKAAIARMTGLSAQAVSVIMRALETDGLLQKGAPVRGKVGQPSVPMGLNGNGAFFLGLKIGRRSTELVLIDFLGQVKDRRRQPHRHPTPDGVVAFANGAIDAFIDKLPEAHRARVAGLGIALPFRLWEWGNSPESPDAISPGLAAWRERDIATDIGQSRDFPVYLCNDASAACGAELVFGEQNKPSDFLYVYVGYFVGGGLVLDKTLYTGKSGNAAALGSMPVVTKDGSLRQLVEVASLVTLETMLQRKGHDTEMIWDNADKSPLPRDLLDTWLDQAASGLAQAIVSSACLIDVRTVLIDGWVSPDLRAELVLRANRQLQDITVPGIVIPEIRPGTIGRDARSLGAASLPLSDRFLVDRKAFLKG